ncbi:hypothetical protein C7974DRAFT_418747 [Boeremia exigua]|uniref:uncharacterized protein n=1 Tax=Boeremia exigua TaxID=749465 RepID=UPI001E8DA671|nr:uncharacterized protein C7974DRAFT_418747 [Boeremia exigua]KAH6611834.1 hypothetical protein C7974DRAFT_418747 [Boeremia exigua]
MKLTNLEIFVAVVCSWLSGFVFALWRTTTYITDREASLVITLSIVVIMVVFNVRLRQTAVLDYLARNVIQVQNMTLLDVQANHRKHIATLKLTHNNAVREANDEIRRLNTRFDRLHAEYDYITIAYQDQMRANDEQGDRIAYLEHRLAEFGQGAGGVVAAPFSAPASQTVFAPPPVRVRGAVRSSSPLSRAPMVQDAEDEE